MRKTLVFTVAFALAASVTFGQAVRDRNVVPVAVNLNQVLRMTITNGGNIEFVFNTIDDYKNGLSGDAATSTSANPATSDGFYQTDFTVASSTRWKLSYGSEEATFIGTDNPANTLALDNVGFTIVNNGAHNFEGSGLAKATTPGAELFSTPTDNDNTGTALETYPVDLLEDNDDATSANAGDATDNDFTLVWRCGTAEAFTVNPMNTVKLIDQQPSPTPDRYVTNVLFELSTDN
ncbi:MAG: hypothetical protein H6585_10455 [Flavobacteriales bacterium]|nr:hypothetical protein [Flavobacteriales bacterium]MCB9448753.1 hypothetical protein [Flavobacteriales bacterium]